ncbi:MAG: hypothetical protein ACK4K0_12860 [Flavobacteriales bacterium]
MTSIYELADNLSLIELEPPISIGNLKQLSFSTSQKYVDEEIVSIANQFMQLDQVDKISTLIITESRPLSLFENALFTEQWHHAIMNTNAAWQLIASQLNKENKKGIEKRKLKKDDYNLAKSKLTSNIVTFIRPGKNLSKSE